MKLNLAWIAPTTGQAVEFYSIWYGRKGFTPQKKIEQGMVTLLDLTDGPGLYRIEITACLANELCSEPAVLEWWCDDHSDPLQVEIESIRLTDEGPVIGFNAKPDKVYTLQSATTDKPDEWVDGRTGITGNGFMEIPASVRCRILEEDAT